MNVGVSGFCIKILDSLIILKIDWDVKLNKLSAVFHLLTATLTPWRLMVKISTMEMALLHFHECQAVVK